MSHPTPKLSALPMYIDLRLCMYDLLFQDLLVDPKHLDTFVLPNEWPVKSFALYRTLALVCKQANYEVKDQRYVGNITIYFDNVPALYKFSQQISTLRPEHAYQKLQVSLRTPVLARSWTNRCMDQLNKATTSFMRQCGDFIPLGALFMSTTFPRCVCEGPRGISGHQDYGLVDAKTRNGRLIHTRQPRAASSKMGLTLRQIHGTCGGRYAELRGRVEDLVWKKFDIIAAQRNLDKHGKDVKRVENSYSRENLIDLGTALGYDVDEQSIV